jgi:hypothetical protein
MINFTTTIGGVSRLGDLLHIDFTVTGTENGTANTATVTTAASVAGVTEKSLVVDQLAACETSAEYARARDRITASIASAQTPMFNPANVQIVKPVIPGDVQRERWTAAVDDTVAAVLGKFTRFQMGYTQREAAAVAYRAAGYTGDPTIWITRFADNNGMSYTATADLILTQADGYRDALEQLEALRMDKYKILRAPNLVEAKAAFDTIMAQCLAIYETLE